MVGPVIIAFGSDAQKKQYLPRILSSEDWWCQGYSEPGSGSDLASLKTRAERQGDHYIVNGQKTWNTHGQWADMMLLPGAHRPASGKKQEGISFLLIDMHTPGVTVRPIITLDGEHEVNEVWFENVEGAGGEPGRRRRAGAGPTPSSCCRTSAPASPAWRTPSASCSYLKHIASQEQEGRQAADRGSAVPRPRRAAWRST